MSFSYVYRRFGEDASASHCRMSGKGEWGVRLRCLEGGACACVDGTRKTVPSEGSPKWFTSFCRAS